MRAVLGARGRPALVVVALCAALLSGVSAAPVSQADSVADRKARLDRALADIRDSLEGTSDDLVKAAVALKKSEADLVDARESLATARARLAEAQRRDAELATRLQVAKAEEGKAVRDLDKRQAQESRTRSTLGQIAREAYLTQGLSTLSVALEAQNPDQFADRMTVASTALRVKNTAIERLDVQQAETRARQAKLTAVRAQVADLKRQSAALVQVRQEAQQQAAQAEAAVSDLVAEQKGALATIAARKAAEQARLAAMTREQQRLSALLAAQARADARRHRPSGGSGRGLGPQRSGGGFLSYPVSAPITSGFGMRFHPVLHYWRLHAGTDFGAPCGTPVRAPADGRVVRAGWAGGFGNQIVVNHGYVRGVGLASSVNHLSRIVVHGGRVHRGQLIGYSGTTGLSTGCHLHFEVYVNGTHVNPMRWL